jgi:hypothetical protein
MQLPISRASKPSVPELCFGFRISLEITNSEPRRNNSVTWMRFIAIAGKRNPAGASTKPQKTKPQ